MLNPDGKTDLYVNLRCMNITSEVLTLYAGGGLLASSELEVSGKRQKRKCEHEESNNVLNMLHGNWHIGILTY